MLTKCIRLDHSIVSDTKFSYAVIGHWTAEQYAEQSFDTRRRIRTVSEDYDCIKLQNWEE